MVAGKGFADVLLPNKPYPENGVSNSDGVIRCFTYYTPIQGGLITNDGSSKPTLEFNDIQVYGTYEVAKGSGERVLVTESISYPFSPLINDVTFDNSIYNALINNFNDNRSNRFLMDVDYLNSPTIPVNQKLLINGTAKKAQVPDSNYTTKQIITPRYLGSKVTSANYNFPTPRGKVGTSKRFGKRSVLPSFLNGDIGFWEGDSSYGNTAAIDKNPIYFAHFRTSTENINLPGTYTFNIDSLIQVPFENIQSKNFFPSIIKIDGSNDNLLSTVSTFEKTRKATVSYNNTSVNGINYSRLPVGNNIIYQGGTEINNILWNITPKLTQNANPTLGFKGIAPSLELVSVKYIPDPISYLNVIVSNISSSYSIDRFSEYNPFRLFPGGFSIDDYRYSEYTASGTPLTSSIISVETPDLHEDWNNEYGTDFPSKSDFNESSTWLITGSIGILDNLTTGSSNEGGNIFQQVSLGEDPEPGGNPTTPDNPFTSGNVTCINAIKNPPALYPGDNKFLTCQFTLTGLDVISNIEVITFSGNWEPGDTAEFRETQISGKTGGPNSRNLILKLNSKNFQNDGKGYFSLGGPALVVSSSKGSITHPGRNVFIGTALTAINTINQSISNQTPYLAVTSSVDGLFPTQSFGIPDNIEINPNDPNNYIQYDISETILQNTDPSPLITNKPLPQGSVLPGFNITGSTPGNRTAFAAGVGFLNVTFATTTSLSDNLNEQPYFAFSTDKFKPGDIVTFSSQSFGATTGSGSDLQVQITNEMLADFPENKLSYYKNTSEPFVIQVGDEIKIQYDTTFNNTTNFNTVTYQVTGVPNNGFDNGVENDSLSGGGGLFQSSVELDGEFKLLANTSGSRKNMLYFCGGSGGFWRSSTNCFDRINVTPNPELTRPPIPQGKINNVQITRRVNADDRVILFQNSPPNSKGATTPSGPGFIIPNDLTNVQKLNVESLISLLNEKNTFKEELPEKNEGLTS